MYIHREVETRKARRYLALRPFLMGNTYVLLHVIYHSHFYLFIYLFVLYFILSYLIYVTDTDNIKRLSDSAVQARKLHLRVEVQRISQQLLSDKGHLQV